MSAEANVGVVGLAAMGGNVNIGIGYVGLPFRFGAWPEITVLKLVREKE